MNTPAVSTNDKIREALHHDALAEAEKITGKSYKEDEATLGLGFAMHVMHGENKNRLLREAGDTIFSASMAEQETAFLRLGFEEIHRHHFSDARTGVKDTFVIYWHLDGLLGTCESYLGTGRNSAHVYFALKMNPDAPYLACSSSPFGQDADGRRVMFCDMDVREGMAHRLGEVRAAGELLPKWRGEASGAVWLSLIDRVQAEEVYGDVKSVTAFEVSRERRAEINRALIATFPQPVKDAMDGVGL